MQNKVTVKHGTNVLSVSELRKQEKFCNYIFILIFLPSQENFEPLKDLTNGKQYSTDSVLFMLWVATGFESTEETRLYTGFVELSVHIS